MNNMNDQYEIEKRYHPENFEPQPKDLSDDDLQVASDLIAILGDSIEDLDRFSIRHDDIFNVQIYELREIVKNLRKQL